MKRIDNVDTRKNLKPAREPVWFRLSQGRYVGFRRMTKGSAGTWLARVFDPNKPPGPRSKSKEPGGYNYKKLGDFGQLADKDRFDAAKKDAETWFEHMGAGGAVKPGTVRAACETYVEAIKAGTSSKRRKRPQTPERNKAAAQDANARFERLVYRDPIARVDLAKLTQPHVDAWVARIRKAGGSDSSFNRNATALRAALNHAKRSKKVTSDAAWAEALKPFEDAGERRTLYLPLTARRKLVENASDESRPLFAALTLMPMRPGEIAALKVEHLDVAQRVLRIPTGKTEARIVPLTPEALAHFKACAKNKLPSAWLVSRADGSQWKKEAWRDEIKLAAAGAKLPRAIVAYTLRHSGITDLVTDGTNLFTVAKLAGTSIAMIEEHYGHLQQDHARKALSKLSLGG